MSDLLVHWAVFDDSRRICQQDPMVDPYLAELIQNEREFARLGALSRGGRSFVPAVLQDARSKGRTEDARDRRKLAFALGGITHFAADKVLKPLMSRLAKGDWNATHHEMQGKGISGKKTNKVAIREISAYYDTHVFRKVYLDGQERPFTDFLLSANRTEPGKELEDFVHSLFQRTLLSSHTIAPDTTHPLEWLDRLIDLTQPLYVDIELYVDVFANPDPVKMNEYQVESTFYQDTDPIVRAARQIQKGGTLTPDAMDAALIEDGNLSAYGQALALSQRRLRDASAFWRGETDETPDIRQ